MSDSQRLGAWGWFVRAFAAGFGAMFGVMVAGVLACAAYALVAFAIAAAGSSSWFATNQPTTTVAPTPVPAAYPVAPGLYPPPDNANGYGAPAPPVTYGAGGGYSVPTPYDSPPGNPYTVVPVTNFEAAAGDQPAAETPSTDPPTETPSADLKGETADADSGAEEASER